MRAALNSAENCRRSPPMKSEVLTQAPGGNAKKDPTAAAQILRSWLYDEK